MPIELKIMITWFAIFFSMIFMEIVVPEFVSRYSSIKNLTERLIIGWILIGLFTAVYLVWT